MSFAFDIAGPADDAAIRALLARNPVPGRVVVSYEREPSYFDGVRATDPDAQVIVARERASGDVVAVACRSVRRLFVNGEAEDVGYLSQLRVDARFRGRWLVSGGFKFLRELHGDRRVERYLATITREGREARVLLVERPRRHFPRFDALADLATIAVAVGRRRRVPRSRYAIERAAGDALHEAAAFVDAYGRGRQFYPVTTAEALAVGDACFVARGDRGRVAGALRVWDQRAYKQAVVRGYAPLLGRVRPVYNAAMRVAGRPDLPAVGEPIRCAFAATVGAESEAAFAALLRRAYNHAAESGYDYLMVGLATADPYLRVAKSYPHVEYRSTLYDVHWNDTGGYRERIDARLPYVEIATL